jgi:polysaccharide export outer membrane protein
MDKKVVNWSAVAIASSLLILIWGCASSYPRIGSRSMAYAVASFEGAAAEVQYRVGRGDKLAISVWENEDLNTETVVRPDGKISFPLIGDIQASGLTLAELDTRLTTALKEYIRYPEVSIVVEEVKGSRVVVLGEVEAPGVYPITGEESLLEAGALAGGFTEDAVLSSVIVIRRGEGGAYGMRADLTGAIERGRFNQNIYLQSGDIVYVPKKFIANVKYFVDQIKPALDLSSPGTAIKALIEGTDSAGE